MKKSLLTVLCVSISLFGFAQTQDDVTIKNIFDTELTKGQAYSMLEYLTKNVGSRLSGSPGAAEAVKWGKDKMERCGFDTVWLQPVMVPQWVRGQKEVGRVLKSKKTLAMDVNVCALGGSIGTGPAGLTGNIIEVKNFEDLEKLGTKNISGKIVFFNRPMDPTFIQTFAAYGGAVNQRVLGASEAAKYGAIGSIVRSMSLDIEDYPHTGMMRYDTTIRKIPAIAISTLHADLLSKALTEDKNLQFYFETHCETLNDVPSFNVIGELRGGEYKDEIIYEIRKLLNENKK